jgi:tripartite-type tricarboxylate transporter receptor subunit TctC
MNEIANPLRRTFLLMAGAALAPPLMAQGRFPSKMIRIVVPFAAGGVGDALARLVSTQLATSLGSPVIVENLAGGDGVPGTTNAARAAPDGHTILQLTSAQIVNMALPHKLPYDLLRDFTPVTRAVIAPIVLVVPSSHPAHSVAELVAYSRTKKDGLAYGSGATESTGHLSGELFKRATGLQAVHVPYKGTGAMMPDLIGGRLDFTFLSQPDAVPQVFGGRTRALAVTTAKRIAALPDVPTMVELGYRGFEPSLSWGYLVPRGTPDAIVRKLSQAMAAALGQAATQERLHFMGFISNFGGPAEYGETIRSELRLWSQVIRDAGIKAD